MTVDRSKPVEKTIEKKSEDLQPLRLEVPWDLKLPPVMRDLPLGNESHRCLGSSVMHSAKSASGVPGVDKPSVVLGSSFSPIGTNGELGGEQKSAMSSESYFDRDGGLSFEFLLCDTAGTSALWVTA